MNAVDTIIATLIAAATLTVVYLGGALGSECFLAMPVKSGFRLAAPPTSEVVFVFVGAMGYTVSVLRPKASIAFSAVLTFSSFLGMPVGIFAFDWSPGWAQFAVVALLAYLTYFCCIREYSEGNLFGV